MKYLGLDLGSKTLGMAISDSLGIIARVYETYRFAENEYDDAINYLVSVIHKEKIDKIILGYPKHMNNDIGIRAKLSEDFKNKLASLVNIEIILWDERLTSMAVNKLMLSANVSRDKRKLKKDELAAQVILQNYLDFKK